MSYEKACPICKGKTKYIAWPEQGEPYIETCNTCERGLVPDTRSENEIRADILQEGIWHLNAAISTLNWYKWEMTKELQNDHFDAELLIGDVIEKFHELREKLIGTEQEIEPKQNVVYEREEHDIRVKAYRHYLQSITEIDEMRIAKQVLGKLENKIPLSGDDYCSVEFALKMYNHDMKFKKWQGT